MIYFYEKNETPKSKNKISINLLKCVHKEDFIKEIGKSCVVNLALNYKQARV